MKNSIFIFVLIAGILNFTSVNGQTEPCASTKVMDRLFTDFPEAKGNLDFLNRTVKESAFNKNQNSAFSVPSPGSITVPVVVYIVHDGTALTNISDAQVNDQMVALNNYFYDTGIKFCLATKVNGTGSIPTVNTTDVQTTPGIIHINNASLSNHYSNSQPALVATASPQITKDRYLRIWVVKSIDGPNSGIAGYSMFPYTSPIFDGIVMKYDFFGNGNPNLVANYNQGKVLAHEVGHYFALYHTFEGGCSTYFNDCSLDGDRVCDTPRVAVPNFNCVAGTNSCPDTPAIPDDLSNYMDYGNNFCQTHFTVGQIERMLMVLSLIRDTLSATENLIYTGTCGSANLLSATMTVSDYTPCASPTVATTFTAPPANTYAWDFGDAFANASNPNTANTQSATHIYTSAVNSPYTVSLTVTNANGESRTSTQKIFVTNCVPIHNYNTYWYVDTRFGLDFSTGKAIFDPSFPTNNVSNVACGGQNDSAGNLLFYTDRYKIWNRQHQQINASDLSQFANHDSNQILCLPKPPAAGNPISQYYILTQQHYTFAVSDIGFRYSIVNVNGTNATMGVIAQPIIVPSIYGFDVAPDGAVLGVNCISAVQKCNSNDYWIITILKKGTQLYLVVFSLTESGLSYVSERAISGWSTGLLNAKIEIAPNGNKIFVMTPFNPSFICDFNKAEGIIGTTYTTITVPATPQIQLFGCSFSPDSNLLYISDYYNKKAYQFNINSVGINSTGREISLTSVGPWSMQLGPDNKLYVAMGNGTNVSQGLSVIHNPNTIATTDNPNSCNFSVYGPKKPGFNSYRLGPGLPNLIDAQKETAYFPPNTPNVICKYITGCNTYKFFPNVCGTSFVWTFTNTTTGTSISTTDTNPTYNFAQNGTYIVTVKDGLNNLLGTSSPIVISSSPTAVIDGSTTACLTRANEKITNNSTFLNNGETATWAITGGTGNITGPNNQSSVNISWSALPGTIKLTKVDASGCTSITTKTITSFCAPLSTQDIINNGLTISPNPSNGLYTIHAANSLGKVSMQVFDVRGRIVLEEKNIDFDTNEKTIDLSGCQLGMYILKIIGADFNFSHKLIKN